MAIAAKLGDKRICKKCGQEYVHFGAIMYWAFILENVGAGRTLIFWTWVMCIGVMIVAKADKESIKQKGRSVPQGGSKDCSILIRTLNKDFLGVLMPMRMDDFEPLPEWAKPAAA